MKFRMIPSALLLAGALLVSTPATAEVSREDFKVFMETKEALQDERVQKMPEAKRLPAIASKNFSMSVSKLQAILDRVEAEGGEKAVAETTQKSVSDALSGTSLKDRIKEVRTDASAAHVVTYITWLPEDGKVEEEAVLLALKAGQVGKVTSTFRLVAVDAAGKSVWQAKIGADRTSNIKEDRIADWAKTRYLRLFEVDRAVN